MTIHEAIFSTVRQPLLGILYLLLTAQMALLLAAFRAGRSRRFRLVCLLHVLMSFFCLWMPFMDIDQNFFQTNVPALLPPARSGFTTLPAWVLFLYEALTALVLPVIFWDMHRFRMEHPTFSSIKETMDLLPAGIAYGKEDGTVVLSNLTMNRLSRAVTGKGLTDLNVFWEALPKEEADNGKAERRITLADGSGVWSVSSGPVIAAGGSFVQLTAAEITEQARVTRELEEKNQKLKDKIASASAKNAADEVIKAGDISILPLALKDVDANAMRTLGDDMKQKLGKSVIIIASDNGGKVNLLVMASDDAVAAGIHAGNLIKAIAPVCGGGGGGRPNMAQAGGKDASKIKDALAKGVEEAKAQAGV